MYIYILYYIQIYIYIYPINGYQLSPAKISGRARVTLLAADTGSGSASVSEVTVGWLGDVGFTLGFCDIIVTFIVI